MEISVTGMMRHICGRHQPGRTLEIQQYKSSQWEAGLCDLFIYIATLQDIPLGICQRDCFQADQHFSDEYNRMNNKPRIFKPRRDKASPIYTTNST